MAELKPCPFCGSKNINPDYLDYELWCDDCDTKGPTADSKKDAIVKWNKRVNNDK